MMTRAQAEVAGHQKRFTQLVEHVTMAGRTQSPMILAVVGAIRKAVDGMGGNLWWVGLEDTARRVFKPGDKLEFAKRTDGQWASPMVLLGAGEWHVTNADLETWRDLCFFGKRDYFPDRWHALENSFSEAIHNKRLVQTWTRYRGEGGVKDEHRKLAARLRWKVNFWRGDGSSLYVQGKRPFGDSGIDDSIARILGWHIPEDEDGDHEMTAELTERAWELFDELQFAMTDILAFPGRNEPAASVAD